MTRAPLAPPPRRPQRLQEVRAPPPQVRCRDTTIHNTFMCGDMKGVYAVLKDPGMVNALMETVQEEMVWTPEMGMSIDMYMYKYRPGGLPYFQPYNWKDGGMP